MHPKVAAIRRIIAAPIDVTRDKLCDHLWSFAEQRLPGIGGVPGLATSLWRLPTSGTIPAAEQARCTSAARRILDGEMQVFGQLISLTGLDWSLDPLSGLSWPLTHHSRIDVLDLARPSDARVVWEVNRCQHLLPLAQAYALSGDEAAARACVEQMHDWIQRNPTGRGINWTSSMEVAIRGVVWSWLRSALGRAEALTQDQDAVITRSLWAHAEHIERHLEHEEHSGNHYLANALGLIVLGAIFGESRQGQRWLRRGQDIMDAEVPRQFFADGVNYEGSVAYHGLALEMGLLAQVALLNAGSSLSSDSLDRLERALDVTLAVTRADGSYPAIGDVDDGQILPLGPRPPRSQAYLLGLGAVLFKRSDLARAGLAGAMDVVWLLGENGLQALHELAGQPTAAMGSQAFPHGGLFVQRNDDCHLTIDCGDIGSLGRGGHGHADLLSFECFGGAQPLVVDGGTFTYSADGAARRRYRGTAQHNTLAVDDRETLRSADLWSFQEPTHPRLLKWSAGDEVDIFGGRYELPGQSIWHERWVAFDRARGAWLIDDRVSGSGVHHLVLRLHVPSVDIELSGDAVRVTYPGAVRLLIQPIEGSWAKLRADPGTISPMYRQETAASAIVLEGSSALPARCLAALVPYEGQCPDRESIREWALSREQLFDEVHPRNLTDATS